MAEIKGASQHVERPMEWHLWEVTPNETAELTGTVDIALDTLPLGTVIGDCFVQTLVGDTGATTAALDVEVGTQTILDCGADSLGTVNFTRVLAANLADISASNALTLAAEQVVNCEITYAGTATVGPTFVVGLLCGRLEY